MAASFWQKTFGGLSTAYYIRQFLFGLIFFAVFTFPIFYRGEFTSTQIGNIVVACVFQLLYPYARFVYESIVGYIMGDNVFFVSTIVLLGVKFFTMMLCWFFAWAIAPIGLAWLYWYHSKSVE